PDADVVDALHTLFPCIFGRRSADQAQRLIVAEHRPLVKAAVGLSAGKEVDGSAVIKEAQVVLPVDECADGPVLIEPAVVLLVVAQAVVGIGSKSVGAALALFACSQCTGGNTVRLLG